MAADKRRIGPRKTCPACKSENVTDPIFCSPQKRVWAGFFKRCSKDGKHLHQKCKVCDFAWTCTPAEVK